MSHITPSTVSLHELMPRRTVQLDDRPWDPGRSAFCAAVVAHTHTHTHGLIEAETISETMSFVRTRAVS